MPKVKFTLDGVRGLIQEIVPDDNVSELTVNNLDRSVYARRDYVDNLFNSFSGSGGGTVSLTGSNIFGSLPSNTHQFTGSVNFNNGLTGSLFGTSSFALNSNLLDGLDSTQFARVDSSNTFNGNQIVTGSLNVSQGITGSLTGSTVSATTITSVDVNVDFIDFNTSSVSPTFQTGRLYYDQGTGDLQYNTNVTDNKINLGQQLVVKVKNASGAPINKGKLVRITGGQGSNPLISTASYENDSNSANTLGMVMNNIIDNDFGYVLLEGVIENINLDPGSPSSYIAGQVLYLSSSGNYTNIPPTAPKHAVRLGEVVRAHQTQGVAFIRVQNGYELEELHDLLITSASNGDLISFNSSDSTWRNTKTLSGSYNITGSLMINNVDMISFTYQQEVFVSNNGNDSSGNGSILKPFQTISGAINSISDASPSKRYLIKVAPGFYTEGSLSLKANVFISGDNRNTVRISGSISLHNSFSGSGDNRSGFSNCIILDSCNFDWNTVQSAAGKLFFESVSFNSTVSLNGYNNSIAQAQFHSCQFFGALSVSGINVGAYSNNINFSTIAMNQHSSLPTILVANGGNSGNVTLTTTVDSFDRRCSLFARSFLMSALTINGKQSYADVTDSSLPSSGATTLNSGSLVFLNQFRTTGSYNSPDMSGYWTTIGSNVAPIEAPDNSTTAIDILVDHAWMNWLHRKWIRYGVTALVSGSNSHIVNFSPYAAESYVANSTNYVVNLNISNTSDLNPLFINTIITNKSSSSFTFKTSQNLDSNNYVAEWNLIEQTYPFEATGSY